MTREDELFDKRDAAKYCGVCERTIRHWHTTGKLKAVRLSRRIVRFERSALESLIQEGKREPKS